MRLPYEGPDPAEPLRVRLASARSSADQLTAAVRAAEAERTAAASRAEATRMAAAEATAALAAAQARFRALERSRVEEEAAAARAAGDVAGFQSEIEAAANDDSPRSLLPVIRTADGVTADRPILVECIAAGATLHPYGITIPTEVAGPAPNDLAPIVAGVKAASAATGESYVLLIVRPDGLPAFYRVATALSAANVPFGYELLDEEAEIAWGDASPDASTAVAAAVRDAMRRVPAVPVAVGGFVNGSQTRFPGAKGGPGSSQGSGIHDGPGPFVDGEADVATGGGRGVPGADRQGIAANGTPGSGNGNFAPFGPGLEASGASSGRAGRGDLSKNFPGGSPADRLSVAGPIPGPPARPQPMPRPAGRPGGGGSNPPTSDRAGSTEVPPGGWPASDDPFSPPAGVARNGGENLATDASAGGAGGAGPSGRSRSGNVAPDGEAGRSQPRDSSSRDGTSDSRADSGRVSDGSAPRGSASGARAAGESRGPGGGRGGGASGTDNRIRFLVRTSATVAASHLWIGGRWAPLPENDDQLASMLRGELDRVLADRGEPPAGFRWSPELRLSVRSDGRGQVQRIRDAAEKVSATVKLEGGSR
ncbi:hypothetical protein LzC2_09250 [Planctomycetes bacterium LzC2]|uniref:Uncharacterized protein n=1 Tax=Alienimonas chondri TaxID=2681879 RepID=A0ABX1V9U2_9PLAN|nr:hypothetical protein [Alienimonas chondri]